MSIDIEKLEALERAATLGPWWADDAAVRRSRSDKYHSVETISHDVDADRPNENAALIAAMRNALPGLLAELRDARAKLAACETVLKSIEWIERENIYGHDSRECPVCMSNADTQHATDCALAAALASKENAPDEPVREPYKLPADQVGESTDMPQCLNNPEPMPLPGERVGEVERG